MRGLVAERGLSDEIEIDCAGVGDWHIGKGPDERAIAAGARRGIELGGQARQVSRADFEPSTGSSRWTSATSRACASSPPDDPRDPRAGAAPLVRSRGGRRRRARGPRSLLRRARITSTTSSIWSSAAARGCSSGSWPIGPDSAPRPHMIGRHGHARFLPHCQRPSGDRLGGGGGPARHVRLHALPQGRDRARGRSAPERPRRDPQALPRRPADARGDHRLRAAAPLRLPDALRRPDQGPRRHDRAEPGRRGHADELRARDEPARSPAPPSRSRR